MNNSLIDQSNWSRPFSLVVMMPDLESGRPGFASRPGHLAGSSYSIHAGLYLLLLQLVPGTRMSLLSQKVPGLKFDIS